jgi:hypothetical protein
VDVEDIWRGCHEAACAAGESQYLDPSTGYRVFTAESLLKRGRCCGCGRCGALRKMHTRYAAHVERLPLRSILIALCEAQVASGAATPPQEMSGFRDHLKLQ